MRHPLRSPFIPSLLVATGLLAACSDPYVRGLTEPGTDTPSGVMYTISGVVVDSISGEVLPGVRVAAGGYGTEADAAGQWTLTVPAGYLSFSSSPVGYERTSFAFNVRSNTFITLMARRLAPLVQNCVREGDYVRALVSDLQGRKTVERWQQSEAIILDPSGDYRIGAPAWSYLALDYVTWQVTVGPVTPESTGIRWNVFDEDGHAYSATCEPVTVTPGD